MSLPEICKLPFLSCFEIFEVSAVAVHFDIFFFCFYLKFFSRCLKVEAPAAKKMKTSASNGGSSGHSKQPNIMNFFKKK